MSLEKRVITGCRFQSSLSDKAGDGKEMGNGSWCHSAFQLTHPLILISQEEVIKLHPACTAELEPVWLELCPVYTAK